jgi:hypothetical protein
MIVVAIVICLELLVKPLRSCDWSDSDEIFVFAKGDAVTAGPHSMLAVLVLGRAAVMGPATSIEVPAGCTAVLDFDVAEFVVLLDKAEDRTLVVIVVWLAVPSCGEVVSSVESLSGLVVAIS